MKALATILLAVAALHAAAPPLKVRIGKSVVEMHVERYIAGVLAGESSVFQSREALQAMAVAARTYAMRLRGRHASEGFDFCDSAHCQRVDLKGTAGRMEAVAAATAGELLWFEGKLAFTPYTGNCGGRSEDVAAVWPDLAASYLKSRADEYCMRAGDASWRWSSSAEEIATVLRRAGLSTPPALEQVTVLDRTASQRARILLLTGRGASVRIAASSFRFAIGRDLGWNGLRSDRYRVHSGGGRVSFDGTGAGHGVGLCQLGAEQMGREGRDYREILAHYYPGTRVGVTAQGLSWQRLRGESITLVTTRPDRDRFVLSTAERVLRSLAQRLGWPQPRDVEVRVYPDLDAFRNATGEPGWVAGYTEGRRVHLQPAASERALAHELAHVLVESQAAPGLPLWFREGLAGYLEKPMPGTATAPKELELRDRSDRDRARKAQADATAAVSGLVRRYGEGAVLGWVTAGLPPEVRNASSSREPAKSR